MSFFYNFLIIFIIFSLVPLYSNNEEEKIINLLYKNKNIKLNSVGQSQIPLDHKETYNTFIGYKDSRFLNYNYRENGIDISNKILYLKSNQSVEFIISVPLNHKIYFKSKENTKLGIYLNDLPIKNNLLTSSSNVNSLKIESSSEVHIQKLFLQSLDSTKNKNDIVFIVIDSLRGDVPGFNGGTYNATPYLDEFSKNTYVLQNHLVNSSWTRPSTLIFFTGIYPSKSFINFWDYPVFKNEKEAFYSSNLKPLPSILSENGYRTVLIGNNPFFTDHRYIGVDVGFEEVYEFSFLEKDTPLITNRFHKFWDERNEDTRPVFLFLNYNDPHKPYEPPFEFTQKLNLPSSTDPRKKNYLGEVAYVDSELKTVIKKLQTSKSYSSLLLLLTSDHGEVMQESHAKSKFTDVYTLYGHGQGLYEEDIHTPLLLKLPLQKNGKQIKNVTRSIDLYPTILDYSNIREENKIDGTSLRPILEGEEVGEREYYGESRGVKGVRKNGWKYMKKTFEYHREGPAWDGRVSSEPTYLYNLKADPKEVQPLLNLEIEKSLKEDFKKGNLSKNLYHIRLTSNKSKKKEIKVMIQVPYGSIIEEHSESTRESVRHDRQFSSNYIIGEDSSIEKVFSIYPDVVLPKIELFSENQKLLRGELGVGAFDLFPNSCSIESSECSELFVSQRNVPKSKSKFRAQVWMSPSLKKVSNEKIMLEKEAIDILKRQGYIQ